MVNLRMMCIKSDMTRKLQELRFTVGNPSLQCPFRILTWLIRFLVLQVSEKDYFLMDKGGLKYLRKEECTKSIATEDED